MNTNAELLAQQLYVRLPAIYRLRDAEQGRPLRDLVAVIAEQIAAVHEGLEQAYDDLFIETCAEWVIPYIGDLIGARQVYAKAPGAGGGRAEVADTLGLRRRKGTLAALEQSARVVTGFPAVAVEFFTRLAQTQFMNHVRPENLYTASLRDELALERLGGPFGAAAHTLEVRRITSGRGRYNIPNIGVYLFRIQSYGLVGASAAKIDDFRYAFNPLGSDTPLYNEPETEVSITQFAAPQNVPLPISRVEMKRSTSLFYGANAPVFLTVDGAPVPESQISICNLSDLTDGSGGWAHAPDTLVGIDPLLGRIAMPSANPAAGEVIVNYRYGFSDALGGGGYERGAGIEGTANQMVSAASPDVQAALGAVAGGGILEFADSQTYTLASAAPNLSAGPEQTVEIRAVNGARPVLRLTAGSFVIQGGDGAHILIDGLVLVGGALQITGSPASVTLRHCTLVPGIERTRHNWAAQPGSPSLVIEPENVTVVLERCIVGAIQAAEGSILQVMDSIIDACGETEVAFSAGGTQPGGTLKLDNSTVIGCVYTYNLERASNVIFAARSPEGETALPLRSERTQEGCVRFCVLPDNSRTPRRYHCQFTPAVFTSLRFGMPGYCQLSAACPAEIRTGADDESEIGVFHDLFIPQRESDLRTRMDEYLRFGLEAGIFYAS